MILNPNFLRQRHKSRQIWDQTRRVDSSYMDYVRAILYELQPIRFSYLRKNAAPFLSSTWDLIVKQFLLNALPDYTKAFYGLCKGLTLSQWCMIFCVILYWQMVKFFHRILDAGPIILILTALIAIFTVGLDDNTKDRDGNKMSAYNIFNRGFRSILGGIDAENLIAQHIGGPAALLNNHDADADAAHQEQDINGPAAIRRRRRRGNREQHFINNNNNHDHQNDNNPAEHQQGEAPNIYRARLSGKKARRRNLETRREIQRQRQAAMDMRLDDDHEPE